MHVRMARTSQLLCFLMLHACVDSECVSEAIPSYTVTICLMQHACTHDACMSEPDVRVPMLTFLILGEPVINLGSTRLLVQNPRKDKTLWSTNPVYFLLQEISRHGTIT